MDLASQMWTFAADILPYCKLNIIDCLASGRKKIINLKMLTSCLREIMMDN